MDHAIDASPLAASPLSRCAVWRSGAALGLALAAMALPGAARAQAFQGSAAPTLGAPSISTGAGVTSVIINNAETVINWTPTDTVGTGTIDFLPVGTTASFTDNPAAGLTRYTVLNRILPVDGAGLPVAREVAFNGVVQSNLAGAPGGDIWFYSPTGIIVGSTGVFNVGSLVLSTNDIDTTGGLFGPTGEIRFRGPPGSTGHVVVQNGAQLSAADPNGSYLALVAPRVVQGGTVTGNGSMALVGAEDVDITFSAGLVDVRINSGTDDANGVVHTGTTTGAASTGVADVQQLRIVAMPKNTALTMLLSGNIGYAPAASAAQEGSAVILSAGYDPQLPPPVLAQGLGNMTIAQADFSNPVLGDATGAVLIDPGIAGVTRFQGDAFITAGQQLTAVAQSGAQIIGQNNLTLTAGFGAQGGTLLAEARGGGAGLPAGQITVTGNLSLNAPGLDVSGNSPPVIGANSTGGSVTLYANGGLIDANTILLDASAVGGTGLGQGGTGTGGSTSLIAGYGGSINATALDMFATGGGGLSGTGDGGNGIGGTALIRDTGTGAPDATGGALGFGDVTLNTTGIGGRGAGQSGNALSGAIGIQITAQQQNWTTLTAFSEARGGQAFAPTASAGNASGRADAIVVTVDGAGQLNMAGNTTLSANATAGIRGGSNTATAGGVALTASNGGQFRVDAKFSATANATVGPETYVPNADTTPTTQGGSVAVLADGGTVLLSDATITANGEGAGALGLAGTATGGSASAGAQNGGLLQVANGLQVFADGLGAGGPLAAQAQGGTATLFASDGRVNVTGAIAVTATAASGGFDGQLAGDGFNAVGGTASVELRAGTLGTAQITAGSLFVDAIGDASGPGNGGLPIAGNGGTGTGGNAALTVAAGTLTSGLTAVSADGFGGNSDASFGAPFQSGSGQGGTTAVTVTGGAANPGVISIRAVGFGGSWSAPALPSQAPALAGNGSGGNASLNGSGGTLFSPSLQIDASGVGGAGMEADNGSAGGNGSGGTARVVMPGGSTFGLTTGTLILSANGFGGAGGLSLTGPDGNGGNGTGGTARYALADGTFDIGDSNVVADGVGGDGGSGGNGVGGDAGFVLVDTLAGPFVPREFAGLQLNANAVGGAASSGAAGTATAGSTRLTVQAGAAGSGASVASNFSATANGAIAPAGNGFTGSISGADFIVFGDTTIATSRDVAATIGTGTLFDTRGTLTITTPRSVTGTGAGGLSGGSAVAIQGDTGVSLTNLNSGGTTLLRAVNGPVLVGTNLGSTGQVTALGRSVDITSLGALAFADADATAGNLAIRTAGNLTVATVDATGAVTLTSTGGVVRNTGAVNGNAVAMNAATTLQVDAAVTATNAVNLQAGGTLNGNASIIGQTITAGSADIVLGPSMQLGQRGTTQSLTLINTAPATTTFVAGAAQAGGYSLDQGEFGRIFADQSITFTVPGGTVSAGDFVVGNLGMIYGGNGTIGTGGTLKLDTPGRVQVVGAVRLITSSNTDTFSIDPTRIDVIGDTASIIMEGGNGTLQGRLDLTAGTIAVASSAKIADIAAATSTSAINDLLGETLASAPPSGILQAGTINFDVTSGLFVQNVGETTDYPSRLGFTANAVNIVTRSPLARIVVNGITLNANGTANTGLNTAATVTINGVTAVAPGQFDRFSTINGCIIGTDCKNPGITTPPKSGYEGQLNPKDGGDGSLSMLAVVELADRETIGSPPLIDEPVTGIGNDDLWLPTCNVDDGARCESGETGQ